MRSNLYRANLVIHSLAIAHAVSTISLKLIGWSDDWFLSALTIIMIFLIGEIYSIKRNIIAPIALFCCVVGFFAGTHLAHFLHTLMPTLSVLNNGIVTLFLTELFGWGTLMVAMVISKMEADYDRKR